jgi:hypothetical protein
MDAGGFGSHFSLDRGAQGRRNAAHFKDLGDEEPAEKAGRIRRRPFIEVPFHRVPCLLGAVRLCGACRAVYCVGTSGDGASRARA